LVLKKLIPLEESGADGLRVKYHSLDPDPGASLPGA
jgi:hypothetical protein